ncbi:MAG: DUF1905 domain-containing protein [Rhodoluna sp.]
MEFSFAAEMWEWRGPAPFYFLSLPNDLAEEIKSAAALLSYGWGMIPVTGNIRGREFKTSMFSKNGTYMLPIKNEVRLPLKLNVDDLIEVTIRLQT